MRASRIVVSSAPVVTTRLPSAVTIIVTRPRPTRRPAPTGAPVRASKRWTIVTPFIGKAVAASSVRPSGEKRDA